MTPKCRGLAGHFAQMPFDSHAKEVWDSNLQVGQICRGPKRKVNQVRYESLDTLLVGLS